MTLLTRSGGHRATDTLAVFSYPEPDEQGLQHIHFFAQRLRDLPSETANRIGCLATGEPLRLVHDFQNLYDPHALILCTEDRYLVGYCPQYLLDDAFEMLRQYPNQVEIAVERVNPPPTPLQSRLLCNLTAHWHENFHPFSSPPYQIIRTDVATASLV